ncbi:MAG: hypothetical protein B6241_07345 [Spirochaetaceae bacterium 4572_59]|nr:MAG: hypothetical protein B6241_07345 [Spirochaetaceae bacterium 4572_59]
MSTVAVILADGFEEIEGITPIDFMRRAGIEVISVGLTGKQITGAHNIIIQADIILDEFKADTDGILIPGGMPGAANIAGSEKIRTIIQSYDRDKKLVAAICAAPALVLGGAGVLKGRSFTCYPGMEGEAGPDGNYTGERVVVDGHMITGNGPGGAAEFSAAVISYLEGREKADALMKGSLQKGY